MIEVNKNYRGEIMELGKRLKQARLDAGLSQRQLCGSEITRNMLSLIENGSARPSMDTLRYLAARLGKPMSFFLEEEGSDITPLALARAAFSAGELDKIPEILAGCKDPSLDAERCLLLALTSLASAEQAIRQQRLPYARQLLADAAAFGSGTPYYMPDLERRRLLLLSQAAPEESGVIADLLIPDDRELLLRARAALDRGDSSRCAACLEAALDQSSPAWCLLRGDACLAMTQPQKAKEYFHRAEEAVPEQVYPRLERCYEQLEDYKMAYFYARKQRPERQTGI